MSFLRVNVIYFLWCIVCDCIFMESVKIHGCFIYRTPLRFLGENLYPVYERLHKMSPESAVLRWWATSKALCVFFFSIDRQKVCMICSSAFDCYIQDLSLYGVIWSPQVKIPKFKHVPVKTVLSSGSTTLELSWSVQILDCILNHVVAGSFLCWKNKMLTLCGYTAAWSEYNYHTCKCDCPLASDSCMTMFFCIR